MTQTQWWALLLLSAAGAPGITAASHPALLPAVQKIEYGAGSVDVCRIHVTPPASPNQADQFTIAQITQWLNGLCAGVHAPGAALPLTLNRTVTATDVPGANDSAGPNSREAYQISVTPRSVELHGSSTGLFYAFQTLRQLTVGDGAQARIPAVQITDYPSLAYRGFMMDLAHGGVLTEDEVKRQIDFLARWKGNQYYFYAETTIELEGYPLLHSAASWTPASIQRIIAYARQRHVDVVPCVELYGHLHDLFRLEHYAPLSALMHGGEINPRDPRAIALTEDWMRKIAALFPSAWFHVGLDEPWELERADPTIAKPEQFYLEHLRRLSALAVKLGKRPMFWADVVEGAFIFKKYPELYGQLPHDAIAVPWHYSALSDFTPLVKPFADNHVAQVVAPAVAIWEEVSTDFEKTFINIDDFVAAGRKYGALGMVNTGWTDSAQAIYRNALPALTYGAVAAWQSKPIDRAGFFGDYARIEYPKAGPDVSAALGDLARAQNLLRKSLGSETMFRLWDDPLTPATLKRVAPHAADLHECRMAAEDARLHLASAQAIYPESASLPSLALGARMLDFAALKYIYAREIAESFAKMPEHPNRDDVGFFAGTQAGARNHSRVADLMDEVAELRQEYEMAWRAECRPYRLQTALGRWSAEFEYWRGLQARMWEANREFNRSGTRPDLEKIRTGH